MLSIDLCVVVGQNSDCLSSGKVTHTSWTFWWPTTAPLKLTNDLVELDSLLHTVFYFVYFRLASFFFSYFDLQQRVKKFWTKKRLARSTKIEIHKHRKVQKNLAIFSRRFYEYLSRSLLVDGKKSVNYLEVVIFCVCDCMYLFSKSVFGFFVADNSYQFANDTAPNFIDWKSVL